MVISGRGIQPAKNFTLFNRKKNNLNFLFRIKQWDEARLQRKDVYPEDADQRSSLPTEYLDVFQCNNPDRIINQCQAKGAGM